MGKNETRHGFTHSLWRSFWNFALKHGTHMGSSANRPRRFIDSYADTSKTGRLARDVIKAVGTIAHANIAIRSVNELKNTKVSYEVGQYAISSTVAEEAIERAENFKAEALKCLLDYYDRWVKEQFLKDFEEAYQHDIVEQKDID